MAILSTTKAWAQTPATPADPVEPRFDIAAIDVEGATLLDQQSLERAIYPHLGPERTRADVAAAQQALEAAYHAKGYQSVVVEVPRQTVADGVVRLKVIETPIGRVRVTGAKYSALDEVRKAIPSLTEGKVADFNQAQAEITEANRLPARQVTPLVRPGAAPGTLDVDLQVTDQSPLHGSLELNNDRSASTKPLRLNANLRYENLWQKGHTLSLTYLVAPERPDDSQVYAASYVAPIWGTPWSVLAFGFKSDSDVATIGGVNVLGQGATVGLRGLYQFAAFHDISQSLSVGVDYKHFYDLARLADEKVSPGRVDYWPLTATYTLRRQAKTVTTASLSVTAALRGLGDDDDGFQTKRLDARANFLRVNVDLEQLQPLPLGLQLNSRFSGQIADSPLVSSEQFSAGGASSVRGFLAAEALGDNGVNLSFELRSPALLEAHPALLRDWRAYGFIDAASLWVLAPAEDQKQDLLIYSAGLGTRFQLLERLNGDIVAAFPLKNGPTRRGGGDRAYVNFSLKAEF
ncbi:ShlB/FhaC/HecB family hemolysin secretion/activation protein [Caulobacter sp. CCNWLY153]|uniref:ShlB/FhaC/HecB family hemolysin secretion/activation protein n=1 Tax=unclassified Caulobacter TaxID=2648921 RepID=UPI002FEE716E